MTESDSYTVQLGIIKRLNDNPDGVCLPLALLESRKESLPKDVLMNLTDEIIRAWQSTDEGIEDWWMKVARLFYPTIELDEIGLRSSQDKSFKEIFEYAYKNHCPTIFLIPSGFREKHAVAVNLTKSKNVLFAEMIYGLKNSRPIINVTERKVVKDVKGIARDFLKNDREMVIFPPEQEMSFEK